MLVQYKSVFTSILVLAQTLHTSVQAFGIEARNASWQVNLTPNTVNQIEYFTRHGYGVIVPDMLGYGGTDSPEDLESYRLKSIASEMVELLDCEGVDKAVTVGHDFGAAILTTLQVYSPDRLLALAYVTVGYTAPGGDFTLADVEALNNQTNALLGYPVFGYFIFHNTERAVPAFDDHLDSVFTLWFTNNATYHREHVAPLGALEQWLSEDRKAPYGGIWITDVVKEQWKTIVMAQGGFAGGLRWYKAIMGGVNQPDLPALQNVSKIITAPTFVLTANLDPVFPPSVTLNNTLPWAPRAWPRTLDSGHFVQMERADALNAELHDFLKSLQ
ncbi:hypothetical protein ACET3X_009508 [Alternaria dauci]|uniref:AB hydrolase-1 domain-containing protein n=1 Tax=Alternaria dauci TaxID=48095 RepID=A0ABR3U6K5_9PLEO